MPEDNHETPCRELVEVRTILHTFSNEIRHDLIDIGKKLDKVNENQNKVEKSVIELVAINTVKEKVEEVSWKRYKWQITTLIGFIFSLIMTIINLFT